MMETAIFTLCIFTKHSILLIRNLDKNSAFLNACHYEYSVTPPLHPKKFDILKSSKTALHACVKIDLRLVRI